MFVFKFRRVFNRDLMFTKARWRLQCLSVASFPSIFNLVALVAFSFSKIVAVTTVAMKTVKVLGSLRFSSRRGAEGWEVTRT